MSSGEHYPLPKIRYKKINFRKKSLILIDKCNSILEDYQAQGFDLTLRQLYYQLVSQNVIPNTVHSYDNLGNLVSDGRLAGLIDWNHIVDRVRNVRSMPNWNQPQDIIRAGANQFHMDWWADQDSRIELWVEKEALIGVIGKVGGEYDIPYYTTKGFNSTSEMWAAAQRFIRHSKNKQNPVVMYLGDHDPSGVEMTRDIQNRLWMFGANADVVRVALNYEQIHELDLPPNPAKKTDPKFASYQAEFGTDSSWELDALPPSTIVQLLQNELTKYIDLDKFEDMKQREEEGRVTLSNISNRYNEVVTYLTEKSVDGSPDLMA